AGPAGPAGLTARALDSAAQVRGQPGDGELRTGRVSYLWPHHAGAAGHRDWEQGSADLPGWPESYRRLVADGQAAALAQPSAARLTREFPPPVEPAAS
ncbi:MAG: hypothetical protein M3Y33_06545, partial [Actinomycetota bacterium]|nr:hypothetical protein [Actinomycetota bacterium]